MNIEQKRSLGILNTLSYQVATVARSHRKRAEDLLNEIGLHTGQEMTLLALWDGGELSQSELAARLGVQKATVTVALRSMEREGLVSREKDPDDQRVTRVRATPKFLALGEGVRNAWARLDSETTAGLSAEEQKVFGDLLAKVAANLQED
jgi:DNA-binding MarR family transcriptional regulator